MRGLITKELLEKAKKAKSAEKLLAFAKENEMEMAENEAKEYYNRFHALGELSDEELSSAAGGCGQSTEQNARPSQNKSHVKQGNLR